jgi:hypothetical protein
VMRAQPTGCQGPLARSFGHQEATAKRRARLLHTARLAPRHWTDAQSSPTMSRPCFQGVVGNNKCEQGQAEGMRTMFWPC